MLCKTVRAREKRTRKRERERERDETHKMILHIAQFVSMKEMRSNMERTEKKKKSKP